MCKCRFVVVTTYYFGRENNPSGYDRLLRSLRATQRELGREGAIVLVANGTDDGAARPEVVVREALPATWDQDPRPRLISIPRNAGSVGAHNTGFHFAAREFRQAEWICSVQANSVVEEGWVQSVDGYTERCEVGGVASRLLVEEQPWIIRSDGHFLREGLTLDLNNREVAAGAVEPNARGRIFPCLSACALRRQLVLDVIDRYGNLICPFIEHYGDCTDIAMRARAVRPETCFVRGEGVVARKRWPTLDRRIALTSQIVAAARYYVNRRAEAERRVLGSPRDAGLFTAVREAADRILAEPYSWTGAVIPQADGLDEIW